MTPFKLTLLAKACLITGLALTSPTLVAAEKTIPELVDAVNGTPDAASREAGKKVKLRNHTKGFCTSGTFKPDPQLQQTLAIPFLIKMPLKSLPVFPLVARIHRSPIKPLGALCHSK